MKSEPFDLVFYRVLAAASAIALLGMMLFVLFGDIQPTNRQLLVFIIGVAILVRVNLESNIRVWTVVARQNEEPTP